ncbi:hypothetical protein OF83DRAFT_1178265 [Amylostereum chailletii]|nr:hypothetical protein OF83DRAFT_1178265 [Amylostereum chailletii]
MDPVADSRATLIHGYLEVAALTFLYHDHLITFSVEASRLWPRAVSRPSFLFFLNRYVPFFGNILVSVFSFTNLADGEKLTSSFISTAFSCRRYGFARQILLLFNQVIVSLLLAMRIIALYRNTLRVTVFVIGTGLALLGVACWSLVGQHSTVIPDVVGCHLSVTSKTGIHIAVAWEAQAAFDVLIFGLTIHRTLQARRLDGRGAILSGSALIDMIYRDGAIYFFVMALANFSNIITFYFASPALKGVLSTFASCVSITMMSRLMLNLYEAATPSSSTADSSGTLTYDMVFATCLDAGAKLDLERDYDSELRRGRGLEDADEETPELIGTERQQGEPEDSEATEGTEPGRSCDPLDCATSQADIGMARLQLRGEV